MSLDIQAGPVLLSLIWTLWAIGLIVLVLRLYVRCSIKTFWWDDVILTVSFVIYTVPCALITSTLSLKPGPHALNVYDIIERFNIILLGAAITLSKLAFGVTLTRLLPKGITRGTVIFLSITLILITIPMFVIPWLQCLPIPIKKNDPFTSHCISDPILIDFIKCFSAWQAFVDFSFAVIAVKTLLGLRMKWLEKIGLSIAMSLGLLSGIMAIVKACYASSIIPKSSTSTQNNSPIILTIIASSEVLTAIVASCLPMIRNLFRKVTSSRGGDSSASELRHHQSHGNPISQNIVVSSKFAKDSSIHDQVDISLSNLVDKRPSSRMQVPEDAVSDHSLDSGSTVQLYREMR